MTMTDNGGTMTDVEELVRDGIRTTKADLIGRQDVERAFAEVRDSMAAEADEIQSAVAAGRSVIPEVSYADIASNSVPTATIDAIHRRGCVIVRQVFPTDQATRWNEQIGQYLEENEYERRAQEKGGLDDYFGGLESSTPQIFGIYWSQPQVQARQAESMAATKRFLNHLWDRRAPVGYEFDPDHDFVYADRIRRRAPGDTTLGLSPHTDAGSFERWVDPAYQRVYRAVFEGAWREYDPWKAAHRTQVREFDSSTVCSVFRTFQGWTAMTAQGGGDGTLRLLPVANAVVYVLLRSLLEDVPDDELVMADPGTALGIDDRSHPELVAGMVSIPLVEPGDTVWWHPDVNHAVEDEHGGSDFSNVIYIGASPRCAKNENYAWRQAQHFINGKSSPDFPAEDFEVDFAGRATVDDLTPLGRAQMGL